MPGGSRAPTVRQRLGAWIHAHAPASRSSVSLLRDELAAVRVRLAYALLPWWRARARALRRARDVRVNVGCGPFVLPGFLNLDVAAAAPGVVRWDCRTSLPLADGAAAGIRIEHFFEHVDPRDHAPRLLADCHRALAPGGTLRVIVPDAGAYLAAYAAPGTDALAAIGVPVPFPDDLPTRMDVIAFAFHQWHEHRWGYDAESLQQRLRAAGFREVTRVRHGEGHDARLAQDRAEHRPYSLYVEGRK
ncbi:MAG: hypothetical protein HYX65_01225 [Gemmatimonadetes bacterium]|nr:hypothetical protein [Gemmatimonadota bacterium]